MSEKDNMVKTQEFSPELEDLSPELFQRVEALKEEDEDNIKKSVSFWKDARMRLRKNKSAMFALFILTFIILMAIFAPVDCLQAITGRG